MTADVADAPLVQEHDPVRVADGGQAMRDHHHQPVFRSPVQRRDELVLGLRVERRGGFVEDQDAAVAEQTPGDGQSLLLPDG